MLKFSATTMAENMWKSIHSAAAAGPDCRLRAHASRSPLRLAVVGAHGADDWLPSPRDGLEVSHVLADPLAIISRRNESHRTLTHSAHVVVFAPHRHRPPSPLAAAEKRAQLEALLIDLTTLPSQPALIAAAAACDADIYAHYGALLIDEPDRAKRRRALELALEGAQARGPCPGPAPAVQLRPAIAGAGVVGAFGDSWVGMGLGELQAAVARVGLLVQPKPGRAVLMHQDVLHRVAAPSALARRPRYSLVWKLAFVPKRVTTTQQTVARPEWGEPVRL